VEHELEKYKVRRPTVVQPSILIFSLSVCVVIVLVAAEITTQRRKGGKSCCGYRGKTGGGEAQEREVEREIVEGGRKVDGLAVISEEEGGTRKRKVGHTKGGTGGVGMRDPKVLLDNDSDIELQVLVSSDSD
jgi:hypothetical protein